MACRYALAAVVFVAARHGRGRRLDADRADALRRARPDPADPDRDGRPHLRRVQRPARVVRPRRAARTAALLSRRRRSPTACASSSASTRAPPRLLQSVRVTAASGRNLVTVAASGGHPQRAADIANAFAKQAIAIRTAHFQSELQTAIASARARLAAIPPVQRVLPASRALQARLGTLNGLVGTSDPTLEIGSAATAPTAPERTRSLYWIPVAFAAAMLVVLLVLTVGRPGPPLGDASSRGGAAARGEHRRAHGRSCSPSRSGWCRPGRSMRDFEARVREVDDARARARAAGLHGHGAGVGAREARRRARRARARAREEPPVSSRQKASRRARGSRPASSTRWRGARCARGRPRAA